MLLSSSDEIVTVSSTVLAISRTVSFPSGTASAIASTMTCSGPEAVGRRDRCALDVPADTQPAPTNWTKRATIRALAKVGKVRIEVLSRAESWSERAGRGLAVSAHRGGDSRPVATLDPGKGTM